MEEDEMAAHLFPRFEDVEDLDGPSVVSAFHLHSLLPPRRNGKNDEGFDNDNSSQNDVNVEACVRRKLEHVDYGSYHEGDEGDEGEEGEEVLDYQNDENGEGVVDEVERAAIQALQEAAAVDPYAIHDALQIHAAEPLLPFTSPHQLHNFHMNSNPNFFREDTTLVSSSQESAGLPPNTSTIDAAISAQLAMMTAAVASTGNFLVPCVNSSSDHIDKAIPRLVSTPTSSALLGFLQKASLKHKKSAVTRKSQKSLVDGCLNTGGSCFTHGDSYRCPVALCSFYNEVNCPDHVGNKNCMAFGCTKSSIGGSNLCLTHSSGKRCGVAKSNKLTVSFTQGSRGRMCNVEGCTKNQIRYGFCSGHGGRAKCKVQGCEKFDRGQGKCKAHGGGYYCKVDGCNKKDRGGGFCASHGGGKKCSIDGCLTPCVGGGRCKLHGGGRRCANEGCMNWALTQGKCKEHGATGRRCSFTGCDKFDQGGGYCLTHGGGFKCIVSDCGKKGVRFGRCCAHGGKPRCSIENCDRMAQRKGLCKAHGGYTPCEVDGCPRRANGGRRCINHGGGGMRCKAEGCDKTNRGGGYCKAHGGGKKCTAPECNEWVIGGGQCTEHALFSTASKELDISII